jgi:glycosyltransferase involved in cell wall biosynthesis
MSPSFDPASGAPAVTVLIPVHNGAATVESSARSALDQVAAEVELLLIDDGSTDSSATVCRDIASSDGRARHESNGRNLGLAATLNRGFAAARGRFVLVLHQDCVLEGNDWIARALPSFQDPSVIAVSGTPRHDVGSMGLREKEFWIIRDHTARSPTDANVRSPKMTLFSENKCDLMRRDEILGLGGFDARLRDGGEDQVLAWRLRASPWRVVFRDDLPFRISLAQGSDLGPHLKREWSYGRQMRQILGITGFGAMRGSPGSRPDPRLRNRIIGIAWIVASLVGLIAFVGTRDAWFLLLVVVPPALRWLQFGVRASRVRQDYRLSRGDLVAIGPVGLLADLAYALGTVSPARGSTPATTASTPQSSG